MKLRLALLLLLTPSLAMSAQQATNPDAQAIFERTKAATVLVLTGAGAGRLSEAIATGVVISKDGDPHRLPCHQRRFRGTGPHGQRRRIRSVGRSARLDERRDVAALKISAGALPALTPGSTASLAPGDPVFAVTNASGLAWSATEGILSAIRPAEEVSGAADRASAFCNSLLPLPTVQVAARWSITPARSSELSAARTSPPSPFPSKRRRPSGVWPSHCTSFRSGTSIAG